MGIDLQSCSSATGRVNHRRLGRRVVLIVAIPFMMSLFSGGTLYAQEEEYVPLGPHFFASADTGTPLEYRGIILSMAPAATETVGATYRGFSVSFWNGTDLTNGTNHAQEALATYSYKLPLVDVHLGGVWCSASGSLERCSAAARFSLTSNVFHTTTLAFIVDQAFASRDRIIGASVNKTIYHKDAVTVELRASEDHWDYREFSADGVGGRVIVTDRLSKHVAIDFSWGGMGSWITRPTSHQDKGGIISGASIHWSF
jgi:hypothetical protein